MTAHSKQTTGNDTATTELDKRRVIDDLQSCREAETNDSTSTAAETTPPESMRDLSRRLRSAEATAKMLEETVENYEVKLLDAIADSGQLHQKVDSLQNELLNTKLDMAHLRRQRNELHTRVEELLAVADTHRQALAAAEREIVQLNTMLLGSAT